VSDRTLENIDTRYILIFILFVIISVSLTLYFNSMSYRVKSVNFKVAQWLMRDGAIVVDARDYKSYLESHIPNAVSLPESRLREGIPEFLLRSASQHIVVYGCDGRSEGLKVAYLLVRAGLENAVNMKGGFCEWKRENLPVTAGEGIQSLLLTPQPTSMPWSRA